MQKELISFRPVFRAGIHDTIICEARERMMEYWVENGLPGMENLNIKNGSNG
jgi:hypothetical protein